jgi:hypothetical protein
MVSFSFYAFGDPAISAMHPTTLEITKERVKSKRGDCIVATRSEVGLSGIPQEFKAAAQREDTKITLLIEVNGTTERISGRGSPRLTFRNDDEMVIRKSGYTCDRTLMICSDKAAVDLNRNLVRELKKENRIKVTLITDRD